MIPESIGNSCNVLHNFLSCAIVSDCLHTFLIVNRAIVTDCLHTFLIASAIVSYCFHTFLIVCAIVPDCLHTFLIVCGLHGPLFCWYRLAHCHCLISLPEHPLHRGRSDSCNIFGKTIDNLWISLGNILDFPVEFLWILVKRLDCRINFIGFLRSGEIPWIFLWFFELFSFNKFGSLRC